MGWVEQRRKLRQSIEVNRVKESHHKEPMPHKQDIKNIWSILHLNETD